MGPVVIGPMLSLKKRNKSSCATEKVRAIGAGGRDIEAVAAAATEKVSIQAVVTDLRSHVSNLRYVYLLNLHYPFICEMHVMQYLVEMIILMKKSGKN